MKSNETDCFIIKREMPENEVYKQRLSSELKLFYQKT